MRLSLIILLALFGYVRSHSWIACTDYAEKNGARWDPNKCRGFPRHSPRYAQKNRFGIDTGYDYQPGGAGGKACISNYDGSAYNKEYPRAVYYQGQQAILAHPMKNHGAASCTNPYIPDNGNAIYRGRKWPNGGVIDTNERYSHYKKYLVSDLGISPTGQAATGGLIDVYPKPGYQNAPLFCENTDKSMGTYSFNVPRTLAAGEYTFVWRWSFNGPGNMYTSCFDVVIVRTRRERDQLLLERGQDPSYVACGGKTSDNGVGSTIGCASTGPRPPPRPPTRPPRPPTRPPRPPTRPPRPPTRPPRPPTRPPRPGPGSSRRAELLTHQITGEVMLGVPRRGIRRRYVSLHFDCPVLAGFWNARLLRAHNHEDRRKKRHASIHYDLLQEQQRELRTGKISFTATFDDPCDMIANPPVATIIREE